MAAFSVPTTDQANLRNPERQELFVGLLRESYASIHGCVATLIFNRTDLDDVMQEVCITLWRKFDEFEEGTSFRRWACTVAYHIARAYWRKHRRQRGSGLDDEALSQLARVRNAVDELLELRREQLAECLKKLPSPERQLIVEAYSEQKPLGRIARRLNIKTNALYVRLNRIRARLATCIDRLSK
ncbi:sigma-70 family RNA polymerase sigma factor [Calycomorphotria hydatis]|uniref:RNA polymerase sigma factor CnrH n=1 Tax=Calycomorphotria hydatis TaxID=2528027 RepID=A0A517T7I8_9PLAN|nr:sigma-70 family RNA polymerase sigma factor [Calycomorphotria hydatis]QDT64337.1 RNA polymerase sigma factor CnrH [Calycomorphotria hydatis]